MCLETWCKEVFRKVFNLLDGRRLLLTVLKRFLSDHIFMRMNAMLCTQARQGLVFLSSDPAHRELARARIS